MLEIISNMFIILKIIQVTYFYFNNSGGVRLKFLRMDL